jgi:hypothetical protein
MKTIMDRPSDDLFQSDSLALTPIRTPDGWRWVFASGRSVPAVAGGIDAPVAHPLGPPVVNSDGTVTVSTALNQPTRVTRMIMDLTQQRFIADRLFANGGGVSGGSVIYDEATLNQLYLDRDVEYVAPGAEMPVVNGSRQVPKVAEVEKYGGKFYITDEARDRNDVVYFTRQVRQLSNTIVRKINTRAIEELERVITAAGGALTITGNDWSAAIPNGSNPTAPALTPGADIADAHLAADTDELGIVFDTLLWNPVQANEWMLFYGDNAENALRNMGIREAFASMRVPVGTAYIAAGGQVGQTRVEQPLATETSREGAPLMRQRTWTQSSVRPLFFVDNPFAVRKLVGL